MQWTGNHWQFDDTKLAFDLAWRICREAARECNKARTASAIASAKTVAAVERLAACRSWLAATIDQWDADPWLLNTPDGVVDLRTGEIRPHRPEDYMTKITAVGPRGECPRFLAFLDRITGGTRSRRLPSAHARLWPNRPHPRARAVFRPRHRRERQERSAFNRLRHLGDYHRAAPIETFTATNADRHPTDLAGLRGARLVTATETEEGRRWAESRIKQLTGGDNIAARFMRQDFFEFVPPFKFLSQATTSRRFVGRRGYPAPLPSDPFRGDHPARGA